MKYREEGASRRPPFVWNENCRLTRPRRNRFPAAAGIQFEQAPDILQIESHPGKIATSLRRFPGRNRRFLTGARDLCYGGLDRFGGAGLLGPGSGPLTCQTIRPRSQAISLVRYRSALLPRRRSLPALNHRRVLGALEHA